MSTDKKCAILIVISGDSPIKKLKTLKRPQGTMTRYQCPICSKRACDSSRDLSIKKLSKSNENQADIIIKCHCCKNTLAVTVTENPLPPGPQPIMKSL